MGSFALANPPGNELSKVTCMAIVLCARTKTQPVGLCSIVLALLLSAVPSSSQSRLVAADHEGARWNPPVWTGELTFLAVNSLLGGVTAGVRQEWQGGSFRDGFTRGSFGGILVYAGRRVSTQQFGGAGLLGRELSALGVSVVANASERRPTFERLFLPVGPLHIYLDRARPRPVQIKLDAVTVFSTMQAALQPELRFDAAASVSAGAPVFRAPRRRLIVGGDTVHGFVRGGTIFLSGILPADRAQRTFPHERVHVLQNDFAFLAWSDPVERWLANRSPVGRILYRHIDVGLVGAAVPWAFYYLFGVESGSQLGEIEAYYLEGR